MTTATLKEKLIANEFTEKIRSADSMLKSTAEYVNSITSNYLGIINNTDTTEKDKLIAGLSSENLDLIALKTDLDNLKSIVDYIEDKRPKYKG